MALRLIRTLPGERPLLSPLPRHHGAAWIDARVAAPGPHDFAVRCRRFRPVKDHLTPQRPSRPDPTFRDDRETSPQVGRDAADYASIYYFCKAEYFRRGD